MIGALTGVGDEGGLLGLGLKRQGQERGEGRGGLRRERAGGAGPRPGRPGSALVRADAVSLLPTSTPVSSCSHGCILNDPPCLKKRTYCPNNRIGVSGGEVSVTSPVPVPRHSPVELPPVRPTSSAGERLSCDRSGARTSSNSGFCSRELELSRVKISSAPISYCATAASAC